MYRPTIRMDDAFKDWINDVTKVTGLTIAQVIRLCIFMGAHSRELNFVLENFSKSPRKPLPFPKWSTVDHGYWLKQTVSDRAGERMQENDVIEIIDEREANNDGGQRKFLLHADAQGVFKWRIS